MLIKIIMKYFTILFLQCCYGCFYHNPIRGGVSRFAYHVCLQMCFLNLIDVSHCLCHKWNQFCKLIVAARIYSSFCGPGSKQQQILQSDTKITKLGITCFLSNFKWIFLPYLRYLSVEILVLSINKRLDLYFLLIFIY